MRFLRFVAFFHTVYFCPVLRSFKRPSMSFFAHKQLNTPKKSNKCWMKCENGAPLVLVLESRATQHFFLPTCSHSLGEYLYSKCSVVLPCFASFYFVYLFCFFFSFILFFSILWLNFALSDESDSQSSFRLMSWHCQNRCLAIALRVCVSFYRRVLVRVKGERAFIDTNQHFSPMVKYAVCIHIHSNVCCCCCCCYCCCNCYCFSMVRCWLSSVMFFYTYFVHLDPLYSDPT